VRVSGRVSACGPSMGVPGPVDFEVEIAVFLGRTLRVPHLGSNRGCKEYARLPLWRKDRNEVWLVGGCA
jgi:hypothetical protein